MLRAYSKSEGTGKHVRADYAGVLLAAVGREPRAGAAHAKDAHPALAWAASGSMALTGRADGPPVVAPGHVAACARGAVDALALLADAELDAALDGAALLGERAAVLGLTRGGARSAGGHCRLVRARDAWIAVNLPRADDIATVPAWLERSVAGDPWPTIATHVAAHTAAALVARARLLGLAAAVAAAPADVAPPWYRVAVRGVPRERPGAATPLVVDLSSLWAGPLAAHLLHRAGARVVKVESLRRPDGARAGQSKFFDLLNGGKESVALDFTTAPDRLALARLVAHADIVIESARSRALPQLGIDPGALVRARPGLTWVSITGYGRSGAAGGWIAFGDDAAAAAGFAAATGALAGGDTPLFCGDAIADPLTGLHAAVAALGAHRRGGGVLVSLTLRDVAAHVLGFGPPIGTAAVERSVAVDGTTTTWQVTADGERQTVCAPVARRASIAARPLGADTDAVLRELDGRA